MKRIIIQEQDKTIFELRQANATYAHTIKLLKTVIVILVAMLAVDFILMLLKYV
jgi:hypothetical protein